MLFYFIAAVHTSAIKYSTITVQRKYVGRDMLICRGNRQFGLRNRLMFTCALLHDSSHLAANLKISDVSDDSYRQLNSIFCCVRSESKKITGSGRWRGPIPPPAPMTYWSRVQAGRRDWLQQFQLMNISVHAQ